MAKMTDEETMSALQQLFSAAYSDYEQLQVQRQKALDYYYGRPLGNEIDGRAQVVCKDLMDAVEWTMPSMMRVCATPQAVQFDPVGPEDVEQAKQETLYTNHVLWKKNPGFQILYTWIKDGLYQKVGYVAYWWEVEEKKCSQRFTGLTQDQLVLTLDTLGKRGEVEVVGAEASHTAPGVPQTWDIEVMLTTKKGKAVVEPVPPDEVIVSGDCRGSIKNAKFAGRICKKTRSRLLEEGYSRKDVEAITDFSWEKGSSVSSARDPQGQVTEQDDGVGWATKEITLLDCFTYMDVDDDGYAELRHFIAGGNDFLENDTADEIQLCSWTPIITPHKHVGLDLHDLTEDFQRINTALTRGLLDNTYFSQNVRTAYNKNTVNVSMLQVNRPGGHVAVDGPPGTELMPLVQPDVGIRLLPVIQHFNAKRDERTGAGSMTRGADADVLASSTKGAYLEAKGAANQRIEGFATIFAKTGFSELLLSLHGLLRKNQDQAEQFSVKKDWITTNPADWNERTDLTVSIGLGTAGAEEVRLNLESMGQTMLTVGQSYPGLVQAKNAYAFARRKQEELGFDAEQFLTDPESPEYQQWQESQKPQKDPYVEGAEIKAAADNQKAMLDAQNKAADRAQVRDLTITELEVKSGVDLAKAGIGAEVAIARGNSAPGPESAGTDGQRPVSGGDVGATQ